MKSELYIDVQPTTISMALVEDDRLMEVNEEKREQTFVVGNIYLGRVKKIMPSLNAAFVDVGHEKDAFLHYLDLGTNFLRINSCCQSILKKEQVAPLNEIYSLEEVLKEGSIGDFLQVGDFILVQITKEPINTKGPRVTTEISLAGRNMVLLPYADRVLVSNKIKSEAERSRLKQLLQSIKPQGYGLIVRTVAEGKRAGELDGELKLLLKRWEEITLKLWSLHEKKVCLIKAEIGRTIGLLRDIFNETFENIQVNDHEVYDDINAYVGLIAPEKQKIVGFYDKEQPIFDYFQITRQMKTGLGRTVGFKNGGYLIVERTEALWSIDVNSGSKNKTDDQEENSFQVNMLAADEIAHQLRLRDIGGIIIIDFIDMDSAQHQQELYEHMRDLMQRDRTKHNVLKLSKIGLMQITRQRVRPAVEIDVQEVCPTCHGKGKIQPAILFTDRLEAEMEHYCKHFGKRLRLYVHPYVYAYCTKGVFNSLKSQWHRKYGVILRESEQMAFMQYRFTDRKGQTLILTPHDDSEGHKV